MPTATSRGGASGLTMLELIAVLVILGVLSAVAVTRMGGVGFSVLGDADCLVADLRYAQSLAMTQAQHLEEDKTVEIEINSDGWRFNNSNNHTWRFADGDTDRDVRWGVTVVDAPHTIRFEYPSGDPVSGKDIELSRGGNSITIRVHEETGYVEMVQ